MALFAIADLHLSLGEDKPMDIFAGWSDYVSRLENNWKKVVADNDTVVVSGDISWAMKLEETLTDFTFVQNLPGKKIFLKGNHDYWWTHCGESRRFFHGRPSQPLCPERRDRQAVRPPPGRRPCGLM